MIDQNLNCPRTSSCGRLFDAVSYLAELAPTEVEFEAEAPMRLEAVAEENIKEHYSFSVKDEALPKIISFESTIRGILEDLDKKTPASRISTKFHNTLAQVIVLVSERARKEYHIDTVVLAGGVFLNKVLLYKASILLENRGFKVLRPINYSPNDESISIGQIAFALAKQKKSKQ